MIPIEAAAIAVICGVALAIFFITGNTNSIMNSTNDDGRNSAGLAEQCTKTENSTELTYSYDLKSNKMSCSLVTRRKTETRKIPKNSATMISNNQSSSTTQRNVRMDKSSQTFDHKRGQVNKDDKGDQGALDFKPAH
jgi:hypothetical protein